MFNNKEIPSEACIQNRNSWVYPCSPQSHKCQLLHPLEDVFAVRD